MDSSVRLLRRSTHQEHLLDLALGLLLAIGVFVLYAQTLVPWVLDGDQGEYQFMLPALGIPHPSGFPLYVLLGHLWSGLAIGDWAYRVNLFSAFFGALTVAALFWVLRRQQLHRLSALGGAIILAVIPQFWLFSTVAAVYRLHTFLIVLLFGCLAEWEKNLDIRWLWLAALTFGFNLANHLTILFFAPITGIVVLLVAGHSLLIRFRAYLVSVLFLFAPLLLYLYIPLRASQFDLSAQVLPDLPQVVSQGIVSPFYKPEVMGLIQYFTGASFFGTVTGHLQWQWGTLATDWLAMILENANWYVIAFALFGVMWLGLRRAPLTLWLVGVIVTLQAIALQYGYTGLASVGQFSSYFREYYLPSFIALAILAGCGIEGLLCGMKVLSARWHSHVALGANALAMVLAVGLVWVSATELAARRSNSLIDRSLELRAKWTSIQRYPPEQDAGFVAHWGDLTPLWYLQYADGWRRDVLTIHPPTNTLDEWIASGKPVYLVASLLDWVPLISQKYELTPWGELVRVTASAYAPPSPLPYSANWTFEDTHPIARLSGYNPPAQAARVGDTLDLEVYWQVLDAMKLDDYIVYLSLVSAQGTTPAQDFTFAVKWLPGKKLTAGQRALSIYRFKAPWGTKPDTYKLRLMLYSIPAARNLNVVGSDQSNAWLDLATVHLEPPLYFPDQVVTTNPVRADFGHRVTLLGTDGTVEQLRTGDASNVQMLWKSATPLQDLSASLSLENSGVARRVSQGALAKNYPGSQWRVGEIVRGALGFVVPADLPEGSYALVLRVHEPEQAAALGVYEGWLPRGDAVTLGRIHIVGRLHSYEIPQIAHPQAANFADRIAFLGYALDKPKLAPGDSFRLTLHWQAQAMINESYKVFVHVVDASGRIWTQQDSIPGTGTLLTTSWLPHEVISDAIELTLPQDIPKKDYRLRIGLYDGASGKRLGVSGANVLPGQDFLILDDILVVGE